jgi:hypothetical protein
MLRKGRNQPNLTNANPFMANFFGNKPISIKFTSNPNTAQRAFVNKAKRKHKRSWLVTPINFWLGVHIPLGTSGRKNLVFVNKKPQHTTRKLSPVELEETAAHEIFHAQFERYRRSIGKKLFMDASEVAAYIATLEYSKNIDLDFYRKRVSEKIHQIPFNEMSSRFGIEVSEFIHSEFKTLQRREMIEELKNGHFSTRKQLVKWLVGKMRANSSKQKEILFEMEEYLRRK